jgi:hypothetical protein
MQPGKAGMAVLRGSRSHYQRTAAQHLYRKLSGTAAVQQRPTDLKRRVALAYVGALVPAAVAKAVPLPEQGAPQHAVGCKAAVHHAVDQIKPGVPAQSKKGGACQKLQQLLLQVQPGLNESQGASRMEWK